MVRGEGLQAYAARLKDELEKQEEYDILLKRKQMLEKTSLGSTGNTYK
jgi:hypothetical protein